MARKKKNVSAKQYMSVLRKMAQYKRRKNSKARLKLSKKATKMRRRMIAANRSRHARVGPPRVTKDLGIMSPEQKRKYAQLTKTAAGKKVAKNFKQFWKLPFPPEIVMHPGGPEGQTVPLMGMGTCPEVHLSPGDKGQKGSGSKRVIKGKDWRIATDADGKHVLILSSRPIQKPFKFVGYAPETNYIPSKDIEKWLKKLLDEGYLTQEQAAKLGKWWRHKHGENDSNKNFPEHKLRWPPMYADRNGKVDSNSNFISGKTPSAKIRDWMYGN